MVHLPIIPSPPKCPEATNIGYRVTEYAPGKNMALWYPTTDPESDYQYDGQNTGHVAVNGAINTCTQWPLVVFSHGYTGCGTQSLFFTETLARNGYIVAAPDHPDHGCSITDEKDLPYRDLNDTDNWTDQTYIERRNDIEAVINYLTTSGATISAEINKDSIGLAGHSLGGYTVAGIANAWPAWNDKRIKAALLFSPFMEPFSNKAINGITIPVMYQGAANDFTTTDALDGPDGAYAQTTGPKYFLILADGDHFDWTNSMCQNYANIKECVGNNRTVQAINAYGVAFLNRYLKNISSPVLTSTASALLKYQYSQ